jgi:hypothetical protein
LAVTSTMSLAISSMWWSAMNACTSARSGLCAVPGSGCEST